MNYQNVTGSTGTSIFISFNELYGNASPEAAPTEPKECINTLITLLFNSVNRSITHLVVRW